MVMPLLKMLPPKTLIKYIQIKTHMILKQEHCQHNIFSPFTKRKPEAGALFIIKLTLSFLVLLKYFFQDHPFYQLIVLELIEHKSKYMYLSIDNIM